jgi:cell division protein FtsB
MRDLARGVGRYRYATRRPNPDHPLKRLRWVWIVLAAWFLWAGIVSDHSFYHLWRAGRELKAAQADLARTRSQIQAMEAEDRDPSARAEQAEKAIRERGMAKPGEIVYREDGARPKPVEDSGMETK